MRKLLPFIENVVLLGMGLYMMLLTRGDDYALFLNPKFRWLTAGAGAVLALLAALSLLRRSGGRDLLRTAAFVVMAGLILCAGSNLPGRSMADSPAHGEDDAGKESHLVLGELPYLKLNTAELVYLLQDRPDEILGEPIVLRGVAKRSPSLDAQGRFALLRVNMICCVADSMSMGMMVSPIDLAEIKDGRWVRVFGTVKSLERAEKIEERITLDGLPSTLIYDKALLAARAVEQVSRPRFPYLFEFPGDDHFDY